MPNPNSVFRVVGIGDDCYGISSTITIFICFTPGIGARIGALAGQEVWNNCARGRRLAYRPIGKIFVDHWKIYQPAKLKKGEKTNVVDLRVAGL